MIDQLENQTFYMEIGPGAAPTGAGAAPTPEGAGAPTRFSLPTGPAAAPELKSSIMAR